MRARALALLAALAACATTPLRMPELASSRVEADFATYEIRRVGILPFDGANVDDAQALRLRDAFHAELPRAADFELVPLSRDDLEEIQQSDPQRLGWYRPRTIIDLSQRFRLDGILFGTVTQQRFFPPQVLSLQVELVSAETGLVLWSSAVHLDGGDPRVREGLELFYAGSAGDGNSSPSWEVALLSPERLGRFAAFQIAERLRQARD